LLESIISHESNLNGVAGKDGYMKLAVSGKGGVGKTTFSSLLIRTFNQMGKRVLAIDADPDANLAAGLGIDNAESIVPISEMKELIFERTGAQPGTIGGFFKLNPRVDDRYFGKHQAHAPGRREKRRIRVHLSGKHPAAGIGDACGAGQG